MSTSGNVESSEQLDGRLVDLKNLNLNLKKSFAFLPSGFPFVRLSLAHYQMNATGGKFCFQLPCRRHQCSRSDKFLRIRLFSC